MAKLKNYFRRNINVGTDTYLYTWRLMRVQVSLY